MSLSEILLKDVVYKRLKDRIVNGLMPFGMKISEKMIAEEFSISKTPVRDAIHMLVQEGLLIVKPQSGTFVINLDKKLIYDMMRFRSVIECGCVDIVFQNGTHGVLGRYLETINEIMKIKIAEEDWDSYCTYDYQFHVSIVQMADNEHLRKSHDSVATLMLAMMNQLGRKDKKGYSQQNVDEHREFTEYLLNNDQENAINMLKSHLDPSLKPYLL